MTLDFIQHHLYKDLVRHLSLAPPMHQDPNLRTLTVTNACSLPIAARRQPLRPLSPFPPTPAKTKKKRKKKIKQANDQNDAYGNMNGSALTTPQAQSIATFAPPRRASPLQNVVRAAQK